MDHNTSIVSSSTKDDEFSFIIDGKQAGQRLDRFLASSFPELSRSSLNLAVKEQTIFVDQLTRKSSYKLKSGQKVHGYFKPPEFIEVAPEQMDLNILFEDPYIIVLSKAPNVVVHPGAGNPCGTLVNGLVYHCQNIADVGEDELRPGIVHRLDKDTSGLMVVAKTQKCHRNLSDAFKAREVEKQYHALLHGRMKHESGRLVAPIGRHPVHRTKMDIREGNGGRYAVTNWQLLEEYGARFSLVELGIETGRTHQIRVHMKSLGHPVVGDDLYGPRRPKMTFSRQLLHASSLKFLHPETGRKMKFSAPLWPDFADFLKKIETELGLSL